MLSTFKTIEAVENEVVSKAKTSIAVDSNNACNSQSTMEEAIKAVPIQARTTIVHSSIDVVGTVQSIELVTTPVLLVQLDVFVVVTTARIALIAKLALVGIA